MKIVLGIAVLTLLAVPAYARLTPNDGLAVIPALEHGTSSSAASAALNEHDYFQAPPLPDTTKRAPRCTVRAVVFEKMRLAQACY
jgi:hypothetical protein